MRLIEAQAAEIEFLKGTIEAERRENALTVAALREAIKAMPKALPSPRDVAANSSVTDSVTESAPEAPQRDENSAAGATSPTVQSEAQKPIERRGWFARTFSKSR